ncbi:glycosyltransferase [Glutamicibacter sp. AOP5-A2-7]
MGNLGKSQGLDLVLRSVQPIAEMVELRIVGRGTEKSRLVQLAADLGVEVDFRQSVYGEHVLGNYAWADTCVVSLRPDWPSFEHTVPSKLYELLYFDRHITGLVRGEAAEILLSSGSGAVVSQDKTALTSYFRRLANDRTLLVTDSGGSEWIRNNASLRSSAKEFSQLLENLIRNKWKD